MPSILHLLPVPLGEQGAWQPDARLLEKIHGLRHFLVEQGKTARHWLKRLGHPLPMRELHFWELNEHSRPEELPALFGEVFGLGVEVGLLSEAGCPCIADPGAEAVAWAQARGIEVRPWTGPSSILLALMASGLSGQCFGFEGYLPVQPPERRRALQRLEQESRRSSRSQIFIETPYRNEALLNDALQVLSPDTRLCIAVDIDLPGQSIRSQTVAAWRANPPAALHKRPAVFVLGAF